MRFSILGCLLLLGAGCSVVNSTGGFEADEGCDGVLSLRNFQPHETHRFEARFVQRRSNDINSGDFERADLAALAYIEPLLSPDMTLVLPNAIAPLDDASRPRAQVDFYADVDRSDDVSTADHTWTIQDACVGGLEEFAHNIRFDALPELVSRDLSATLIFCGERGRGPNPPPVEFRATSSVPNEAQDEVSRVTGFYRYDVDRDPELQITLPSFLDASLTTTFEAFVDANDDGMLNDGETAFRWDYDFETRQRCPMVLAQLCSELPVDIETGDVCFEESGPEGPRLVMAMGVMGEGIETLTMNTPFIFRD